MSRLLQFLSREILWGKMAGIAAVAALASQILSDMDFLASFALLSFTVAGIVVERTARKHPFWNALVCGLLTSCFELLVYVLVQLGLKEPAPSIDEAALILLIFAIPTIPLTLIGTGMVVLVRRIAERNRARQGGQQEETPARPGKEPARPGKEVSRPGKEPARPGKGVSRPGKGPARPGKGMPRPGKEPARRPGTKRQNTDHP